MNNDAIPLAIERIKTQFGIRQLLLFVLIVACLIGAQQAYAKWYRNTYSAFVFNEICANQLKNGDRLESVTTKIDYLNKCTIDENIESVWLARGWSIERDDEFYFASTNKGNNRNGCYLQFRSSKLVNHCNNDYEQMLVQGHSNPNIGAPPHPVLRFGILPFVLPALIIGYTCWKRSGRKTRNPPAQPREAG